MDAPILNFALVVLILLASMSSFFGKNLPKIVWWISIISAGLAGFAFAALLAPFPDNLLLGAFVSAGAVLLVIVLRIPRRNQPR
jgi:uncharacterized MnhB-related membrane protein